MTESKNDSKYDLFIADSTFPDAESIFTARYKRLDEVKNDAIIVFDTNALLLPYTVGHKSFAEIEKTLRALVSQGKLVIPGQVAREFAKNRATKIAETHQSLSKKRDAVEALQTGNYPLLESLGAYKEAVEIEKQVVPLVENYRRKLNELIEHIENWVWDDPVSTLYSEVFRGQVVFDPIKDNESLKDEITRNLKSRNTHKIPPGYKDSNKLDEGIGDVIVWETILEVGKLKNKSVIFVSGEEKSDWWHRSNKRPLYPRYELIDEFRRRSGGHTFHIIKFSKLLDTFGVSNEVVEDVRQIENNSVDRPLFRLGRAVADWLSDLILISSSSFDPTTGRGHLESITGAKINLTVVHSNTDLVTFMAAIITGDFKQLNVEDENYSHYLVLVLNVNSEILRSIYQSVGERINSDTNMSIYFGYMTDDGAIHTPRVINPMPNI